MAQNPKPTLRFVTGADIEVNSNDPESMGLRASAQPDFDPEADQKKAAPRKSTSKKTADE